MKLTGLPPVILAMLAFLSAAVGFPRQPEPTSPSWIDSALQSISSPFHETQRWDYLMNVKVRLLLFWIGADDVGGGIISRGSLATDPTSHAIKLRIGSDPAKAPRKINHWGSAMEVHRNGGIESDFFGFMKSSKAASAREAESEVSKKESFAFEANLSHANSTEAFSRTVPFGSTVDFTFRDLAQAQEAMIRNLSGHEGPVRNLTAFRQGCDRTQGFLSAVDSLVQQASSHRDASREKCYVYNARYYMIALKKVSDVKSASVKFKLRNGKHFERTYENLIQANFEITSVTSKEKTRFDLMLGSSGELRGVPIQIHYQPNWWFQVDLYLDSRTGEK